MLNERQRKPKRQSQQRQNKAKKNEQHEPQQTQGLNPGASLMCNLLQPLA